MNISNMSGNCTINGNFYSGNNISIKNGQVFIDGVKADELTKSKTINITVSGNVETIKDCNGSVKIKGSASNVSTQSGDVTCSDVNGSVSTMSGDVSAKQILGNVSTMSGDISKKF